MTRPVPPAPLASARAQVLGPLALVLGIGLAGRLLPLGAAVQQARDVAGTSSPLLGALALAALYVLCELLLIPGSTVSLLAGASLGPLWGALAIGVGVLGSAALGHPLGRLLRRPGLLAWIARRPRLHAVEHRLRVGGWRWVLVLRLLPAVPYAAQNYLAGLCGLPYPSFLLVTALAMLPGVTLWTLAGHLGAELSLRSVGLGALRPLEWAGLGVVGLLVLALGGHVRWRIRRAEGL